MREIDITLQTEIDGRIINGAVVLFGTVDDDVFSLCTGHAENTRQVLIRMDTVIDAPAFSSHSRRWELGAQPNVKTG